MGGVDTKSMSENNLIVGFVGKKGSGKSYAFKHQLSRKRYVVLYDVRDEHGDVFPNRVTDLDDLDDLIRDHIKAKKPALAGRFVPQGSPKNSIDEFCELMFRFTGLTIGFEEVPAYSGSSWMPEGFEQITLQGRHNLLNIFYTGQRFAELPRSLTAQTDKFVLFASREPRDLSELENRVGAETARIVSGLPRHEAVTYDTETGETYHGVVL